jgi:hypothetical protein
MSDATRPGGPAQVHADSPDGRAPREGSGATSSADESGSEARGAASGLRDEAAGVVPDVKAEGAAVVDAAQERAAGFAEEQKEAGAEQADSLARAVHRAADELQGTSPQIARYVHEAASSVGHLARALRDRSPGELMGGVEDLARRQPVAFFGAAVLAGFALARFARSSAEDARPSAHNTGSAYGTRPTQSRSPPFGESRGSAAVGGGVATPRSAATGAPGWVPDPGRPNDEAAARPATMAAASLGGAAARPAATADRTGPESQGG